MIRFRGFIIQGPGAQRNRAFLAPFKGLIRREITGRLGLRAPHSPDVASNDR